MPGALTLRGGRPASLDRRRSTRRSPRKAEFEYLYDKPYPDNSRVRVAGPFTVESLSPHRTLVVGLNDELIDTLAACEATRADHEQVERALDFAQMILENLKAAGVQQAHKEDRITFTSLTGWPGNFICAEGRFMEGDDEKRAGIFIGPEFGTVSRPDLVAAAREAGDCGLRGADCLRLQLRRPFRRVQQARPRAGAEGPNEPRPAYGRRPEERLARATCSSFSASPTSESMTPDVGNVRVKIEGVDVFKPQTGEVVSEGPDGIALWMIDTDYNEESFFVRHAYFLGANDPYKALKTTLKAEIDPEAWASLNSDTSRPFSKPRSGRIAVKVINHLGDEVMKVFAVR